MPPPFSSARYRDNHPYQTFPKRFRWSKQREGIADIVRKEEEDRRRRLRDRVVRKNESQAGTDVCRTLSHRWVSTAWCAEECSGFFCPPELCSEAVQFSGKWDPPC